MAPDTETLVSATTNHHPTEMPTPHLNSQDDYSFTFNNQNGETPLELGCEAEYTIGEHIMWAPRKIRVACIGAGSAGIMFCYKKEKEFGDDIDLVVYERKYKPSYNSLELI